MKKKVIIVGGGVAGLTAGIYAQKHGFQTIILEKNDEPGGECSGWFHDGNYVDGCIIRVVGTREGTKLNALWKEIGALENTKIIRPDELFSVSNGISLCRDREELKSRLFEASLLDDDEITRFFRMIECYRTDLPVDLAKGGVFGFVQRVGDCFRACAGRSGLITVGKYAQKFKSAEIRRFLLSCASKNASLFSLVETVAQFTDGNSDYPAGGSVDFTARTVKKYLSHGGVLQTRREVKEVLVEKNTVRGVSVDGEKILADAVILACDPSVCFHRLLGGKFNRFSLERSYKSKRGYRLPSYCLVSLSYDGEAEDLKYLESLEVSPFTVAEKLHNRLTVRCCDYLKNEKGGVSVSVFLRQYDADFTYWKKLYAMNRVDYDDERKALGETVISRLVERKDALRGRLTLLDVTTPVTYEGLVGAYHGAAFPSYPEKLIFTHPRGVRVRGLKNCLVCGQWTTPLGGLHGAAISGKLAADTLEIRLKNS